MSCYCDHEVPAVYEHRQRTARKAHRCCECRRERIQPGESYHEHTGLWDGGWETFRRCLRCEATIHALDREARAAGECLCIEFGGLRRELRERSSWRRAGVEHRKGGA